MIKFNRRGGEKLITFWWFFVLALVVIGIVGGVSLISLKEINVKKYEAESMSFKIERCLVELGKLDGKFLDCGFDLEKELVDKIEKNKQRKYIKSKSPDGKDVFIRVKTEVDP